jgi:hypothetical protein
MITVDMSRGMMSKNLKKTKEFIVEVEVEPEVRRAEEKAKPFPFKVSPDSLQNVKEVYSLYCVVELSFEFLPILIRGIYDHLWTVIVK